ncbi:hypothetical protein C1Y05_30740, partial [Pseudomonas sp. FW306-02-F04-BA]
EIAFEEALRTDFGSPFGKGFGSGVFLGLGVFFGEELRPVAENVVRGDAEAALDEEGERGLPGRPKVKERAAAEPIKVPEEFL